MEHRESEWRPRTPECAAQPRLRRHRHRGRGCGGAGEQGCRRLRPRDGLNLAIQCRGSLAASLVGTAARRNKGRVTLVMFRAALEVVGPRDSGHRRRQQQGGDDDAG